MLTTCLSVNTSTKSVEQTNEEKMQENSPLYTMAISLDNILQIFAEYKGLPSGGNVDVRTELEISDKEINSTAALAVQSLRQGGDIRRIDAIRALQALGLIDQDTKPEEVIDELKNQAPSFME